MSDWNIEAKPNITVVGATGAVGKELLDILGERDFPFDKMNLLASGRLSGRVATVGDGFYTIRDLDSHDFKNDDIAFFCAGTAVSLAAAQRAASAGCLVIDNTNAYRMNDDCPLVVPQVNGSHMQHRPESNIIGNPNCSTIQLVRVLDPINKAVGIESVVVSTYQAVSGAGAGFIETLKLETTAALRETADEELPEDATIAFNVIPAIGELDENGFTLEEQKMTNETRKIIGDADFQLTANCVRVPVVNVHSEAVYLRCKRATTVTEVVEVLSRADEIVVSTDGREFVTPRYHSGENSVSAGRIRVNPDDPTGVWLWVVADNLRVGAALNAVQIAELALKLSR